LVFREFDFESSFEKTGNISGSFRRNKNSFIFHEKRCENMLIFLPSLEKNKNALQSGILKKITKMSKFKKIQQKNKPLIKKHVLCISFEKLKF